MRATERGDWAGSPIGGVLDVGMFDWDEGDRFSFEDSDRFEEDSLCSWISEPESLCNNWRGWKKQNSTTGHHDAGKDGMLSLVELSAGVVASHIPFEVVERVCPPVPEQLQLRIAFWSFPESEEDIRLYSCLANGSADEFQRGEHLFRARAVRDLLQIGFHLSAAVISSQTLSVPKGVYNVAVTFDRGRITTCNCTCSSSASWCSHVVAVCLHRIHQPNQVRLRAPVSESLSRLHRDQLQKFAQYLISELPQQILPTAQRLLDELLSNQHTAINTVRGAPDPTAGASADSQTTWCLDESTLHENIRKILIKLCIPSPIVFSDVNYLSSTAPPAAAEWSSLLRPLRGREPEGMWNLLSIVREMFRRSDWNAIPLLAILTEEVLSCEQILVWWFNTKVSLHTGSGGQCGRANVHTNTHASQHACSSLCDEIVILWRLAALNPSLSAQDKQTFFNQLHDWHLKTVDKVWKLKTSGNSSPGGIRRCDIEIFQGFKPAMEACLLDWNDYPVFCVTYKDSSSRRWLSPYFHPKPGEHSNCEDGSHHHCRRARPVEISSTIGQWCGRERRSLLMHVASNTPASAAGRNGESNRSSLSSEGFCENDAGDCIEIERIVQCKSEVKPSQKVFAGPQVAVNYMQEESSGVEKEDADSDESTQRTVAQAANGQAANRPNCEQKQEESSDEYQLYYYDPQAPLPPSNRSEPRPEERFVVSVKKIEDPLEILFARAEALHAHGQTHEACKLAVQLAEQLLANPPDLMTEVPLPPARGKRSRRFNPAFHQMSLLASATMAKTAFLCSVLSENALQHHLAFLVGLFGLELPRPPASTKALEVKLANQEQDIVLLLKKIPLGNAELKIIRERAEQLRDGKLRSRGDALLPLMLATYVFDALVLSGCNKVAQSSATEAADEVLGFEAAVSALGFKANVSEAEHPLLCEGTRRQRGDLAITLLVTYKDDQEKLAKIMDKLLDKEVHQMHKSPVLNPYYYTANNQSAADAAASNDTAGDDNSQGIDEGIEPSMSQDGDVARDVDFIIKNLDHQTSKLKICHADPSTYGARIKEGHRHSHKCRTERSEATSSPSGWEEDYKAWEAKFRCTNFRTNKKHSAGMASIDSSAPETTSSDNSPTVVRRSNWIRCAGPGSDSGSSGESSDSFASSSSGDKALHNKIRESVSPPQGFLTARFPPVDPMVRNAQCAAKVTRYKGKRVYPSIPNQPSEASAYFMFELAKTVLTKAGGNSNTAVLFTQPTSSQNHRGPHRGLHMCAFQIGLYALGLHNAVSPNWLSRTYSSHVSWITGQAMEIGSTAINFLIDTWEGHLTPPEVASLADKASRGRDLAMVRAAAELTLSCLPHAHALNPNEVQRALTQCKEQSTEMLERACLAVESAAKGGGVYPEVLFDVARRWHESYEESLQENGVRPMENRNESVLSVNSTMHPVVAPCENTQMERSNLNIGPMEGSMTAGPPPTPIQIMPQLACTPISYALPYNHPYSYIQGLAPFLHPALPFHPATLPPAPPPPTYPYATLASHTYYPATPVTTAHLRPPHGAGIYTGQVIGVAVSQGTVVQPRSVLAITTQAPTNLTLNQQQPQVNGPLPQLNQQQLSYLLSAYRVGMLAMETLARRVHDDRPQAKYARTPPYGEDVKWLLGIAKKLGTSYLQEFCICTVNSVASPFILHDIVLEAAHYLARSGTSPLAQPLRSHILTPLIQKCQQMFIACTHFKMYHITPAEYEDFVNIIRSARSAFQLTPGGMVQFNELLQSLRRSKSCKKELWQRIASAQAATAI